MLVKCLLSYLIFGEMWKTLTSSSVSTQALPSSSTTRVGSTAEPKPTSDKPSLLAKAISSAILARRKRRAVVVDIVVRNSSEEFKSSVSGLID